MGLMQGSRIDRGLQVPHPKMHHGIRGRDVGDLGLEKAVGTEQKLATGPL
jgi:hypothetical protein